MSKRVRKWLMVLWILTLSLVMIVMGIQQRDSLGGSFLIFAGIFWTIMAVAYASLEVEP